MTSRGGGETTGEPLRVLHLEDDPRDVELVQAVLESDGLTCRIAPVSTQAEFIAALDTGDFDLILSDFSLPSFDGPTAAFLARHLAPDVPFIFVSGMLGEDAAIECLRNGATDYVLKRHLAGLAPAIRRAISESEEKQRRRAAEEGLHKERRFLKTVLDSLEAGIVACDSDGLLTLFNRATREFHGLPEERIPPSEWATHYDLYYPDGRGPLALEDIPLYRALQGERVQNVEIRIIPKQGRARTVLASGQPIVDDAGNRQGAVVALHDITERKALEDQLRQSQKMEAIGMLAGGIAHDFNNLLTAVIGYSDIAGSALGPDHLVTRYVEEIRRSAERAAGLTRQLLAFGRKQVIRPRVLDVNELLAGLENMLRRVIGEDVALVTTCDPALGRVKADPTQIEQIVMNLVVNARDAMPKGGDLSIRTRDVHVDPARTPRGSEPGPGRYVMIEVADGGVGIEPEVLSRVFEPFFTTKEVGRGTGLGLATVYGIVKQNGGAIEVDSEVGRGSKFRVFLPTTDEAIEADDTKAAPSHRRGTETILVVEDEGAVRDLVCESLGRHGYTALSAGEAREAMELLRRHRGAVRLLLTDVVLPGMNGRDLATRVRSTRPDVRVVYMSGHPRETLSSQGTLSPGTTFLQKPFTEERLLTTLRAALDEPALDRISTARDAQDGDHPDRWPGPGP